ncbi:hypothetical protein SESBI_50918 [Sesbania bispinosa]|nr:hypothetical protein SESBI_50918 [Sesbania bispinosa]
MRSLQISCKKSRVKEEPLPRSLPHLPQPAFFNGSSAHSLGNDTPAEDGAATDPDKNVVVIIVAVEERALQ